MQISEYVTLGHPDKMADYISSYILDRYIEKDPDTRYAVECQIKNNVVNLAGEITSKAKFTKKQIEKFVKAAVNEIGYTKEYQKRFGKQNTICADDIVVNTYISKQSSDIAQGLKGWGDQGIFFGYAHPSPRFNYLEPSHDLARSIGQELYEDKELGKDIKVLAILKNGAIKKIIIAVPTIKKNNALLESYKRSSILNDIDLVINGTGNFKKHGSIADSGTTGRKLAVDFYGGACKIGGGSPWTKDGSKADLTLNLYARYLALKFLKENGITREVYCDIACAIGRQEINISIHNGEGLIYKEYVEKCDPKVLIKKFGLNKPIYAELCRNGLFSKIKVR